MSQNVWSAAPSHWSPDCFPHRFGAGGQISTLFAIERDKRMVMYGGLEAVVAYFRIPSLGTLE
jgi:hypothetical protein